MPEKTVPTQTDSDTQIAQQERTLEEDRYMVPPVDIYETSDSLVVVADLPGVKKDEINIRVEDSVLTIQARSEAEKREDLAYEEFSLRSYFRQFQLSEHVDQDKISADLKHGVLTVTLPKAEKAKPRQIKVKVG